MSAVDPQAVEENLEPAPDPTPTVEGDPAPIEVAIDPHDHCGPEVLAVLEHVREEFDVEVAVNGDHARVWAVRWGEARGD